MTAKGGYYYLHRETRQLIFKHGNYEFTGDLVEKIWPVDFSNRGDAWRVVLEGAALGARESDLLCLSERWKLTFDDAIEMMMRVPHEATMRAGLHRWVPLVLKMPVQDFLDKAEERMKELRPEVANGYR